ncbi:MAG: hypothetical protein KZQ99_21630 [Candidatus Thiodiazotropha sp. (ex Dulcina madagascariensis)]|nr:hypothetical protein [Candidatus Thiodiazotropha sp. (ex Dulcina madagascariensis)]
MSVIPMINDVEVQKIINLSMTSASGATVVDKVGKAFRVLQERRRKKEPHNIDLAAAEHYIYARFLAGITGDPLVEFAPSAYHIKKKVFVLLGIQEKMQTTKEPVMPPRPKLKQWGKKGARQGLRDWEAVNPGKSKNRGAALKVLSKEALRY